jgi:hypothetical protein
MRLTSALLAIATQIAAAFGCIAREIDLNHIIGVIRHAPALSLQEIDKQPQQRTIDWRSAFHRVPGPRPTSKVGP